MAAVPPPAAPLAGLRVVEFAGLTSAITGHYLAALGANVTRILPPSGDPLEATWPWVDVGGSERSACALAFGANRPAVTLDLALEGDRGRALALAAEADVVLHEYTDETLAAVGLEGLRSLEGRGRIVCGITSFGANGPLAAWRGSDLVHYAMGGYLYMTGERDREPLQPSAPLQTSLHAGLHALAAIIVALRRRRLTGAGAVIDQAIRDTACWMLTHTYQHWDMQRVNLRRNGSRRDMGARRRLRVLFEAKDGHLAWMFTTGHLGATAMQQLVDQMRIAGADTTPLDGIDWAGTDILGQDDSKVELFEQTFEAYFRRTTKAELLEKAVRFGLMLAPVATLHDVLDDPHLIAREAWRTETLPGGRTIRVPGDPIHISGVRWQATEGTPCEPAAQPDVPAPREANAGLLRKPLSCIRVLDLGSTLAAPIVGRHLADLGAEVIKVESATHIDTLRVGTPYAGGEPGVNRSGYFGAYNAGKASVTLDLRTAGGLRALRALVERSDVLLENFKPGVMQKLGLTEERLREWNPRLVFASHSLSGQTGPRSAQRGYGQVAGAMTGWYELTGEPGGEPIGPYSAYTDFLSWPYLFAAIVLALEIRDRTGLAPRIEQAQAESSLHFLWPLLIAAQLHPEAPTRQGNHRPDIVPNNTFRCAGDDRWIALSPGDDAQWRAACSVLGLDDDLARLDLPGRRAQEPAIEAAIRAATAPRDAFALAAELQAAGVAAGPVLRAEDLFADPQLLHRGLFVRRQHAELGDHALITHSFRISGVDHAPARAAPLLGEHTHAVLSSVAGLSDDEIADLAASGALT